MYLLDVETYELHEFQGSAIPKHKYAILSHIWGEGEVSFQDLQAGRGPSKQGYEKITLTCKQAYRDGFKWAWIDTCCIDKTSSAELSEAINSMYRWYKNSARCYAYLSDVYAPEFPYVPSTGAKEERQVSKWFTRAWTLQELIAPSWINFYGRGWEDIGRCQGTIAQNVSVVTRIPESLILGHTPLTKYSAAQKMSWAAHRRSTRPEDIAYSLLGLFGINMPLLYGEGSRKAFTRLQEAILRETDENTLLCWTVPKSSSRAWSLQSVFATSPDDFATSGKIKGSLFDSGAPSTVTNRGLQIRLKLTRRLYGEHSHLYRRNIACSTYDAELNALESDPGPDAHVNRMSIILVRTPDSVNRYARLATPVLGRIRIKKRYSDMVGEREHAEMIYIHKNLLDWELDRFGRGGIHLQNIPIAESLSPPCRWWDSSIPPLKITSVRYSGLQDELRDLSAGVPPNPEGMTWFPFYGCMKFESPPRRAPGSPQFAIFGIGTSLDVEELSSILIAWNEDYIHFSLRPGKLQMPKFLSLGYSDNRLNRLGGREQVPEQSEAREFWDQLIDPTGPSTRLGNWLEMYGEIAKTRGMIGPYDTELTLELEDPRTEAGETAGNRTHLLVRVFMLERRESISDKGKDIAS
ncbi:HET-domain-containing protein [Hypoxylon sp. FL0543]|nr:HET-domain-containing protein [Hypoxylon sp. FL0543]